MCSITFRLHIAELTIIRSLVYAYDLYRILLFGCMDFTLFLFAVSEQRLEPVVHGRGRKADSLDEAYLGVYEDLLYARKTKPVEGKALSFLNNFFDNNLEQFFF